MCADSPRAVYTVQQMKALVLYGQRRGVRVIGEYDMPAHSSFGKSLPQLVSKSCPDQLDPTKPAVYEFLRRFLGGLGEVVDDWATFVLSFLAKVRGAIA